jgi:hypothetical protein
MTRMLAAAPHAPEVVGIESILAAGPLLIIHNHDCRTGLGPWWGTSLVFTTVAHQRGADPAWMVTSEWYYFDRLRSATITPLDRAAG